MKLVNQVLHLELNLTEVIGPVNVNINNTPNFNQHFNQQTQGYFVHAMPQGYPLAGGGYMKVPVMPQMSDFGFNPYNFSQLYQYSGIEKNEIKNILNVELSGNKAALKLKLQFLASGLSKLTEDERALFKRMLNDDDDDKD